MAEPTRKEILTSVVIGKRWGFDPKKLAQELANQRENEEAAKNESKRSV